MEITPDPEDPSGWLVVVENRTDDLLVDPYLSLGQVEINGVLLTIGERKDAHPFTVELSQEQLTMVGSRALFNADTESLEAAQKILDALKQPTRNHQVHKAPLE